MSEYFPEVPHVEYEGPDSDTELAFDYYDPDKQVGDKTMKEHLRFAVSFWHAFTGDGSDPFGAPTMQRPWDDIEDPMEKAEARIEANFELLDKLGVDYFCYHDRDLAPSGDTIEESNENLDEIVPLIKEKIDETGIGVLFGSAELFAEPKYAVGAASSPSADVFAHAGAQVKKALEVTNELGGEGFCLWGGREGYKTLLNTDMGLEQDNVARFLTMVADHADEIGFEGQLMLEPKPKEPMKFQYDHDAATIHAFLQKYDLDDRFTLNIETNHATLADRPFAHELRYARLNDILGSIDANQGDKLVGWDTDEFPFSLRDHTLAMYEILQNGGIAPGGINFDAKVRRESFEPVDLVHGHITGMDTYARALEAAHALKESGELEEFVDERYSSYDEGIGQQIVEGEADLADLEEYTLDNDVPQPESGREEKLNALLNRYILEA